MKQTIMTTYDEAIAKLSKSLIKSGKVQYTVENIDKEIKKIMAAEGFKNKTQGLASFRSDPNIKRAQAAGSLEDVSFDVLSVRDGQTTQNDKEVNFQAITIAINRNGKPEIRNTLLWDRKIDIVKGASYKARINIGEKNRFDIPDEVLLEQLDKVLFTGADIIKTADPVEDAKPLQSGIWYGTVGSKGGKATAYGSVKVEASTLGSFQPMPIWVNEDEADDILKGDEVVFGGYCKTKNSINNVNADFILVVKDRIKPKDDDVLL